MICIKIFFCHSTNSNRLAVVYNKTKFDSVNDKSFPYRAGERHALVAYEACIDPSPIQKHHCLASMICTIRASLTHQMISKKVLQIHIYGFYVKHRRSTMLSVRTLLKSICSFLKDMLRNRKRIAQKIPAKIQIISYLFSQKDFISAH